MTAERRPAPRLDDRLLTILLAGAALVALAVAIVLLLSRSSAAEHAGSEAGPAVRVGRSSLGRILVNADGRTLYLFVVDKRGRSACNGSCANVWPPLIAKGRPTSGPGVTARYLATVRRRDGRRQVTYRHHPLYTMVADQRPGQLEGQGFQGTWFAVSPAGRLVLRRGEKVSRSGGY